MHYNSTLPVAVFVGPSLDQAQAQEILPANYYPPVRMGDIYRLLATGVQTIIVIDGVFHGTTPVWQREILAALQNGITVIGASSMGALRAAELAPYGMIGSGVVCQWYEQGEIEGDDEVSLLHGFAEQRYCALSEPLVNMRYTLANATRQGLIDDDECAALIAGMKARYFGDRTYKTLGESEAFLTLPVERRQTLNDYFKSHAVNIKRQDAEDTLRAFAQGQFAAAGDVTPRLKARVNATRTDELLARGCLDPNGQIILVRDALGEATKDQSTTNTCLLRAMRRFHLQCWMEDNGVNAPAQALKTYGEDGPQHALSACAMTQGDYQAVRQARAQVQWLLNQDHSTFGVDAETQRTFVETCSGQKLPRPFVRIHDDLALDTAALPYVVDWAAKAGIVCPDAAIEGYLSHCYALADAYKAPEHDKALREQALMVWVLEQGPAYFGYTQWSSDLEVTRELQWSGALCPTPAALPDEALEGVA